MNLIVDVEELPGSFETKKRAKSQVDESFEFLLSLTTTVITDLASKSVTCELFVTDQPNFRAERPGNSNDLEPMFMRLAAAEQIPHDESDTRFGEMIELVGQQPTLVLTRRNLDQWTDLGSDIAIVNVDQYRRDLAGSPNPDRQNQRWLLTTQPNTPNTIFLARSLQVTFMSERRSGRETKSSLGITDVDVGPVNLLGIHVWHSSRHDRRVCSGEHLRLFINHTI